MDKVKRARIVYCEGNTDGTIGGSFYSLLYLVSSLDKARFEPIVIFHNEHALLPRYHDAGIKTLIIPPFSPTRFDIENHPAPFRYVLSMVQKAVNLVRGFIGQAFRYARLIRSLKTDILHLNNSIIRNHDWMLAALITGTKCITHERGINNHYPLLARFFARRLNAIICISNAVSNRLKEHGLDHGNLITIYNGIDPAVVRSETAPGDILTRHNLPSGGRYIGVIGNIKPWKGQETIVRAMPDILAAFPDTICLLVGDTSPADSAYLDKLKALCEQFGITDRVCFTGYTSNVADYLNLLDIVIHTSVDDEPFGRVLIEAMAMRKPLIGARGGAVPEIIDDGITGLMFTPGDHESLSQAVLHMLEQSAAAREMGERGRTRLEEKFDIRLNTRATVDLYDRLLPNED